MGIKITVSLSKETLSLLDYATKLGMVTRDDFIEEALKWYLDKLNNSRSWVTDRALLPE